MQIKSVRYARLYNLGNYQNERLEVESDVREDETPTDVLKDLRLWCAQHASDPEAAMRELDHTRAELLRRQAERRRFDEMLREWIQHGESIAALVARLKEAAGDDDATEIPF
jgi:hypothetical protein